ncbi:hypothetical protein T484DRAFT_1852396 [Baffinella frigidus]|nr:hypothetical protein T484DRAFT_1852396 [Cryptophyta sp. CCMP2293]
MTRFQRAAIEQSNVLDIRRFELTVLPDVRSVPTSRAIHLSKNKLQLLGEHEFWDHQKAIHHSLTSLSIAHNRFAAFPLILTQLLTLKELDLSYNKIVDIPAELLSLTGLTNLVADGNPLSSPTIHVVHDGIRGSEHHPKLMGCYAKTDLRHHARNVYSLAGAARGFPETLGESWCIGPDIDKPSSSWLRVPDGALRPSGITSAWRERATPDPLPAGWQEGWEVPHPNAATGRLVRRPAIRVAGLGVWEYLSRVRETRLARDEVKKMRREMDANDSRLMQAAGLVTGETRMETRGKARARIKAAEAKILLDVSMLSMTLFPPEIVDSSIRLNPQYKQATTMLVRARRLTALVSLNLSFNFLSELPSSISRLLSLRTLLLASNHLEEAPLAIAALPILRALDLSTNPIKRLPPQFSALEDLENVDLEYLFFTAAALSSLDPPDDPRGAHNLRNVDKNVVPGMEDKARPATGLGGMGRLLALDLDLNRLAHVPASLVELKVGLAKAKRLETLDVSKNTISLVPSSLAFLPALTSVDLSVNHLTDFPIGFTFCPQLRSLILRKNYIPTIPAEVSADIHGCTALETLNLAHNVLRALPPSYGFASEILGRLTKLKRLDVSHNRLETLPADITSCHHIRYLSIEGNPFDLAPPLRAALVPPLGGYTRCTEACDPFDGVVVPPPG